MSHKNINLGDYRTKGQFILSGKDRGLKVRSSLNLDSVDEKSEKITVKIPDDIYSITSSFFLGLFGESVKHFGTKEEFYDHFEFEGEKPILRKMNQGVEFALNESSVL